MSRKSVGLLQITGVLLSLYFFDLLFFYWSKLTAGTARGAPGRRANTYPHTYMAFPPNTWRARNAGTQADASERSNVITWRESARNVSEGEAHVGDAQEELRAPSQLASRHAPTPKVAALSQHTRIRPNGPMHPCLRQRAAE